MPVVVNDAPRPPRVGRRGLGRRRDAGDRAAGAGRADPRGAGAGRRAVRPALAPSRRRARARPRRRAHRVPRDGLRAHGRQQGLPEDPGQDRSSSPTSSRPRRCSRAAPRRCRPRRAPAPACFAYDTMTPIGAGTWEAARGAVDAALTAADLVLGGERAAYALTRPPGHHATRSGFGGSCYLNNAAVGGGAPARRARRPGRGARRRRPPRQRRRRRSSTTTRRCSTGSVHVDPGAGWFPHFLGFAGERGRGDGAGANLNLPLAPGSGDRPWLEAVERARRVGRASTAPRRSSSRSASTRRPPTRRARSPSAPPATAPPASCLGELGVPTVIVQEGGYDLAYDRDPRPRVAARLRSRANLKGLTL